MVACGSRAPRSRVLQSRPPCGSRCGLLHLLLCLAPVWSFGPCVACQYPMDLLHGPALEESSEDAPPLSRSKLADIRGKDVRQERLRLAKIGQGSGKYASRRWSHSSVFFPGSCLQCQDEGPCFRFLRLSVCPFSLLQFTLPSIMLPGPLAYSTAWHNWGYPNLFLYVFVQLLMQSKTHSGLFSALCRFPLLTIYQLIRTAWFAPFFLIHWLDKCLLLGYSSAYMLVPFYLGIALLFSIW